MGSTFAVWRLIAVCVVSLALLGCGSGKKANTYDRDYDSLARGSYSGSTYTVKRGDTLFYIAWITNSEVSELARRNKIPKPYNLEIGQKLALNNTTAQKGKTRKTKSTGQLAVVAPPIRSSIKCWRWPTQGNIVSKYSTADGGNKGIDIAGNRGQPVFAAAKGRVVYVGNQLRGYGNLIMIKHNDEYISAYAHNNTLLVRNAQEVKAGQKIATMGSTGTDKVMLHFQIRYRATALDPLRFLPPQGSAPSC